MFRPNQTYLDIRLLYASDPNRVAAHYLRRHRVLLMREYPTSRHPELLGSAIVEVLCLYDFEFHQNPTEFKIFNIDRSWRDIGRLVYDENTGEFLPDILDRFETAYYNPNIAFLRSMRLQPSARGAGWGRWFLKKILQHFQENCGLMATFTEGAPKPSGLAHPLLPDDWGLDEPFPLNRLCRGLRRAGFQPIGHTHLFIADLHNSQQFSLED